MTTAELKLDLNRFILDTNDREILNYIAEVFASLDQNGWAKISETEKRSIELGQKDAAAGRTHSRAEVRAETLKILQLN